MLRYGMFAVAGLVLAAQTASADQVATEQLKESLVAKKGAVAEAMMQKDAQAFMDLLSDQQYSITAKNGRFSTVDLLQVFDAKDITSYSLSDAELVDVDENVKILTLKYTWSGTSRGQEFKDESVFATVVWAQRDGEWKSVFYQETPIVG